MHRVNKRWEYVDGIREETDRYIGNKCSDVMVFSVTFKSINRRGRKSHQGWLPLQMKLGRSGYLESQKATLTNVVPKHFHDSD